MRIIVPYLAVIAASAIASSACDSGPAEPASERQDLEIAAVNAEPLVRVANAAAIALQEREVRQFIIRKMAESPWNEHKIRLNEAFLHGSPLLKRAARIANASEDEFVELVGGLPEMDFYLADKKYRATWAADGEAPIVVASSDGDRYSEYLPNGRKQEYDNSATRRPVFAIHPAEVRMYRARRAAPSQGVIAGPGNVDGGLIIRYVGENGEELVIDAGKQGLRSGAEVQSYLRSRGIHLDRLGVENSSAMVAATYLDSAENINITDGPIGQAEVLLKIWKDNGPGNGDCCRLEWNWSSVEPLDQLIGSPCISDEQDENYFTYCWEGPMVAFSNWYPGADQYSHIRLQLFEEDTGSDDEYANVYWGSGYYGNGATAVWQDIDCTVGGAGYCFKANVRWSVF